MTQQETEVLISGEMVSCALTAKGSNYTFLAKFVRAEERVLAIYKPRDGAAPLLDFPSGTLYKREYASYV